MKKLLLILFLIPNLLMAETWVCSYKAYVGEEVVQTQLKKSGKYFIDEWNRKFTYSESANYLSMASVGTDTDGAWVFSQVINKRTGKFLKNGVTSNKVISQRVGTCSLIK
jgi:hypothetical protein